MQQNVQHTFKLVNVGIQCSEWLGYILKLGAFMLLVLPYLHNFDLQNMLIFH